MSKLDYETPPQGNRNRVSAFWGLFLLGGSAGSVVIHIIDDIVQRRRGGFSDGGVVCMGLAGILTFAAVLALQTTRFRKKIGLVGAAVAGFMAPIVTFLALILQELLSRG